MSLKFKKMLKTPLVTVLVFLILIGAAPTLSIFIAPDFPALFDVSETIRACIMMSAVTLISFAVFYEYTSTLFQNVLENGKCTRHLCALLGSFIINIAILACVWFLDIPLIGLSTVLNSSSPPTESYWKSLILLFPTFIFYFPLYFMCFKNKAVVKNNVIVIFKKDEVAELHLASSFNKELTKTKRSSINVPELDKLVKELLEDALSLIEETHTLKVSSHILAKPVVRSFTRALEANNDWSMLKLDNQGAISSYLAVFVTSVAYRKMLKYRGPNPAFNIVNNVKGTHQTEPNYA